MSDPSDQNPADAFRDRITSELQEIEQQSADSAAWSAPVELDQQSVGRVSRIDAMQMQAMAQAVEKRRVVRCNRLKLALARIDDGEFGYCIKCGEEIAPGRLNADPTFATCVKCAR